MYHPLAMDELPHDIYIEVTHMEVYYLRKKRICLKTTDTMTLLKKAMEPYLHVLNSMWQLHGLNIMFMYLILTVVIAMVFIIQMKRQLY